MTLVELKFIYSEKATHFCEISIIDLSYVVTVKSTVEISQNFVAFSEYMNFKLTLFSWTSSWAWLEATDKMPTRASTQIFLNIFLFQQPLQEAIIQLLVLSSNQIGLVFHLLGQSVLNWLMMHRPTMKTGHLQIIS